MRYLKGTKDYGLHFQDNGEKDLTFKLTSWCYVNANHGSDPKDQKSTSGFIILLTGNPISWRSKNWTVVAQSSTEAEFCALSEAIK
jgi:hypothetical protein